ncbi:MAG: EF-Tu/IF-2/RF-3 family GTPase [Candidatus Heimdallarchaeaceae archaeon]
MTDTVCAYLLGSEPSSREKLAIQLGKKGTSSDVVLYNHDKEFTLEVVDPLRYPDKPLAMFQTIFMTDVPIVMIPLTGPDIHTAEFGLLLESLRFENGIIAVVHDGEYFDLDQIEQKIQKMFGDFLLGNYPILTVDLTKGETVNLLKQTIREKSSARPSFMWAEKNHSRVDVDHIFPVKGIGTVILGRVRSGNLKKGETLHVFPSKRNCILRSIQISDVDYNEAETGKRVGLALRGVLPKDVERGFVLSNSINWIISSELDVQLKVAPYSKLPDEGTTRHLIVGLHAVPAKVLTCAPIKDEDPDMFCISLKLDREIAFFHEEPALLIDLNGKPKTIGLCQLI